MHKGEVGQTQTPSRCGDHIQRLIGSTGNFALLAGDDPAQVHEMVSGRLRNADAFDGWEAPNTIGI